MLNILAGQGVRTIALYGVGVISEMICQEIEGLGIEITAVIDDANKGSLFYGMTAMSLLEIDDVMFDRIIVAACDNQVYSVDQLLKAGVRGDLIVTLDHKKYV
jgi:predicted dinucleotide-utilizing enzyme